MEVPELIYTEIQTEVELTQKLNNFNDFELIKILEVPSSLRASELLITPWFLPNLSKCNSFFAINFTINESLNSDDLQCHRFITSQRRILINFESTVSHDCQIMWKIQGNEEKFYSINVCRNLKDFVWNFLISSLKNNSRGLKLRKKSSKN